MEVVFTTNKSNALQIQTHLKNVSNDFVPALQTYVDIPTYALKLEQKAVCFEAFFQDNLIGLIAGYVNKQELTFYISNVSVINQYNGQGIAKQLFNRVESFCKQNHLSQSKLEVYIQNYKAIHFYNKIGFKNLNQIQDKLILVKLV